MNHRGKRWLDRTASLTQKDLTERIIEKAFILLLVWRFSSKVTTSNTRKLLMGFASGSKVDDSV